MQLFIKNGFKVTGDCLIFPLCPFIGDKKSLVVRKCYSDLWKSRNRKNFLIYFLLRILQEEKKDVVFHREQDLTVYYFSLDGTILASSDIVNFAHYLQKENAWYLVDSVQAKNVVALTLCVSS